MPLSRSEKLALVGVGAVAAGVVAFVVYRRRRGASAAAGTSSGGTKAKSSSSSTPSGTSSSGTAVSGSGTTSAASAAAREAGNDLYGRKEFAAAAQKYTEALSLPGSDEDRAKAFANRAACYAALNNHPLTVLDCTEALALDPKYLKAYQRRAMAYLALKKLEPALDDLTVVLSKKETNPNPTTIKLVENTVMSIGEEAVAACLQERQKKWRPKKAIKTYLESYNRGEHAYRGAAASTFTDANTVDTLLARALAYLYHGEPEAKNAFEDLEKAHALDPENPEVLEHLGTVYFLHRDLNRAMTILETSIDLYNQSGKAQASAHARCKLANVLLALGAAHRSAAVDQLLQARGAAPNDTVPLFHLGEALQRAGQLDEAVVVYETLLALDNKDYSALNQLGLTLYQRLCVAQDESSSSSDFQRAEESFKNAIELFPGRAEAYISLAFMYVGTGRHDLAHELFDVALEREPDNALALTHKAMVVFRENNPQEALDMHLLAIKKDPECVEAYCNYSMQMLALNRLDEAIAAYDKAIEHCDKESDLSTIFSFRAAALSRKRVLHLL